jgi:hypothetical protein
LLFNKKIDPCCNYCINGVRVSETEVGCIKRGIVSPGGQCKKFKYDPLKRSPAHPASLDSERFSEEDFTL